MTLCPNCQTVLRASVKKKASDGTLYKSCPECSGAAGMHVFYPFEAYNENAFGTSDKRVSPNKPEGDQSWCIPCRGLKKGEHSPGLRHGGIFCNKI